MDTFKAEMTKGNSATPVMFARFAEDDSIETRKTVAGNTNTPEAALRTLAGDAELSVVYSLCGNKSLPSDLRMSLAREVKFSSARVSLACNPSFTEDELDTLADDARPEVRQIAAWHANTRTATLVRFAGDADYAHLHTAVADNDRCPAEALGILSTSANAHVRERVALHANTPKWALAEMCEAEKDARVLVRLAANRHTPAANLAKLAVDPDAQVRRSALANSSQSSSILADFARTGLAQGKGREAEAVKSDRSSDGRTRGV